MYAKYYCTCNIMITCNDIRSILTIPWFEFGGECPISCKQSGYSANVEFHTKVHYQISLLVDLTVMHVNCHYFSFLAFQGRQEAQGHSRDKVSLQFLIGMLPICTITIVYVCALGWFIVCAHCVLYPCLCNSNNNYNVHDLCRHKSEKPFMKIEGEWDNILTAKDRSGVSH
jgi:hypothetical protein